MSLKLYSPTKSLDHHHYVSVLWPIKLRTTCINVFFYITGQDKTSRSLPNEGSSEHCQKIQRDLNIYTGQNYYPAAMQPRDKCGSQISPDFSQQEGRKQRQRSLEKSH